MPICWFLIGIPGSGKSTWIKNNNDLFKPLAIVISTDNIVEERALLAGKTYTDIWADSIKDATAEMNKMLMSAVASNTNIIWDQTNINKKTRKSKLAQIPDHYEKIAVFFSTPTTEELAARLASRPGKFIPPVVVENMKKGLEEPSLDEGFSKIIKI